MDDRTARPARTTTIEELETILGQLFTQESRRRGLAFQPRPSDVIISPYAKSGTTWLQQIAHGLRTRGSMDFEDITDVSPWLEIAHDMGWDLNAPQVAEPRVYKSHVSWHDVPKGGRYICSFRNPADAFTSFYRFFEGFTFEPGAIGIEELFRWRSTGNGYWHHLASWWEQRHNDDVLLLCYEDMQADLPGTVRRVAQLMDLELDDELLDIVVRQSSREFMLAHEDRFDEAPFRRRVAENGVLSFDIDVRKVTPGATDDLRHRLPPELKRELEASWKELITPRFGLESYEALRLELRELQRGRG